MNEIKSISAIKLKSAIKDVSPIIASYIYEPNRSVVTSSYRADKLGLDMKEFKKELGTEDNDLVRGYTLLYIKKHLEELETKAEILML